MTPEQLAILIATQERIASARDILAEAEKYKELVQKYLVDVKADIKESQVSLQQILDEYQPELKNARLRQRARDAYNFVVNLPKNDFRL